MEKNFMLLINLRCNVGVNLLNPFIFSIPSGNSMANIRANDAMRKHVGMIPDLRYPDAIRSTNLRKHLSTMNQLLNLQDTELDLLANFMGHIISIHQEFYRLPESTMLLAKCDKILLAMEKGEFQHGGSLDGVAVGRLGMTVILKENLYMHTGRQTHTYIHTCTHMYTHTSTHMYTHTSTHIHSYKHTHTHSYTHTPVQTHPHARTHTHM